MTQSPRSTEESENDRGAMEVHEALVDDFLGLVGRFTEFHDSYKETRDPGLTESDRTAYNEAHGIYVEHIMRQQLLTEEIVEQFEELVERLEASLEQSSGN